MQPTRTLQTYVCGSSGPLDDFNPFLVMKQKWAPELLCALNERPLTLGEISSALEIDKKEASKLLGDLTRIKAVKEQSGIYSVTFSIFTRKDLSILKRATRPIASEISNSISDHKREIDSFVKNLSSSEQVGRGKLLFATLGCFVLDWLGLKTLEDEGVLIKSKPQPGNRNYVLFAREQLKPSDAEKLYGKMYWGSNTDEIDRWVFTSFGDFTGVRYAFPDVVWSLGALSKIDQKSNKTPSWMSEKMSNIFSLTSKRLLKDVGLMLSRLNSDGLVSRATPEKNSQATDTLDVARLLEDMNYISREKGVFKLNYPVFTAEDSKVIEQLGNLVSPFITKTFHHHCSKLQESLRNTSPIRNKVEFTEVLNDAWHWIFAQTNRILAEKGFLYDPPKKRAGEARYIAWMSEFHPYFP